MAEAIKIENHYLRTAENLPTQFRDKPNIDAIVKAWSTQIQDLEDHIAVIPVGLKLHLARGVNLDRFGEYLGINRPAGFNDDQWFGIIAGELAARASNGTVDSIRETTEALTQMYDTNIIEINNTNYWASIGTTRLTGDIFVYGYYNKRDRLLSGEEGNLLKAACPITTDVAIFGQHIQYSDTEKSLFIPCEISFTNDEMGLRAAGVQALDTAVTDAAGTDTIALSGNNFDKFGPNWENAVMPEESGGGTQLAVNALDPGFEDFLVRHDDGHEEQLHRFYINIDGVGTDHGIFLEISTST